jgi:hypothetical protein
MKMKMNISYLSRLTQIGYMTPPSDLISDRLHHLPLLNSSQWRLGPKDRDIFTKATGILLVDGFFLPQASGRSCITLLRTSLRNGNPTNHSGTCEGEIVMPLHSDAEPISSAGFHLASFCSIFDSIVEDCSVRSCNCTLHLPVRSGVR